MRRGTAFLLIVFSALASSKARAAISDVNLKVAVQTKEGERIDKGIHILELLCGGGECWLTSISLNQCIKQPSGKQGFYPKVEKASTRDGTLAVQSEANALIVTEKGHDMGGSYVNTLRFTFRPVKKDGEIATELAGFSGGMVKNSAILQTVLSVEYVPAKMAEIRKLDCGVLLPGV